MEDYILKGGFKDGDLIITECVSSEDIDNLMIEIYEDCIRDHRVSFITKRKIGKLNRIMRDWEIFRLNTDDFSYTKHELWIKYNDLLKFVGEIERLDKELLETANKYDIVGRKIQKRKYESEPTEMKTCRFRDLGIGDTFMFWDLKAVKIAEYDMNKDTPEQPANNIIIDAPNEEQIGHYGTVHANAPVKLVKSKGEN